MQYASYDQIPWYRKNWFAVLCFAFFPPALLPILLTGDIYYQRKGEVQCYSKITKGILLIWGVLGIVQISFVIMKLMGESDETRLVKSGQLALCPGYTVEQIVDGYMASPSWDSGESSTGEHFVNIDGDVTFQQKQVRASIQFQVSENNFTLHAIELNGVPSANLLAVGLLTKMCQQAMTKTSMSKVTPTANNPALAKASERFSTPPTASEIAGKWANDTTTMTIDPIGDDFNVTINVGASEGCAGEISGRAKWMGKHIMLESGEDGSCAVQITPEDKTIWLGEDGCSSFHGTSCSFDGELNKQ